MILNINKALIVIASIFYIQNIYAQYNLPPVEDDKFFDALIQELDFFEADWMDNHSITRDIILGASWVNQDDQENYLGEIIFPDKKLNKKLKNKGNVKDDIAVLLMVVTNNSKYRIIFDGSSAIIINAKENKIQKSKLEDVFKRFKFLGRSSTAYGEMRIGSIRSNLLNKSIKKIIVEPGESSSSLLFIPASSINTNSVISVPIQNLRRLIYLDLQLNLPTEIS